MVICKLIMMQIFFEKLRFRLSIAPFDNGTVFKNVLVPQIYVHGSPLQRRLYICFSTLRFVPSPASAFLFPYLESGCQEPR